MSKKKQKTNRKIILGMIFAIVLSFFTYSYAIASTTLSVSSMKTQKSKITELKTEIAELDAEYFEIMNSISLEKSQDYSLKEVSNIDYIEVSPKETYQF